MFVQTLTDMAKDAKIKQKRILVRLPQSLWVRIEKRSEENNRSFNGEVINILYDSLSKSKAILKK